MKTQRRNALDGLLTITRRNKKSKKFSVTGTTADSIPTDLIIEILLRLPGKSLARFRLVSKLWDSIYRGPYFPDMFLTRSQTRPQLLFAIETRGKFLFFSSPQNQNTDVNYFSPVVSANELASFPFDGSCSICGPVHGWICLIQKRLSEEIKEIVPMICNPSTGQSLTLPKLKLRTLAVRSYFVYDPFGKQFKVLTMSSIYNARDGPFNEFQILTIVPGKNLSWRIIESSIPPHYSSDNGIFIDGVLYYRAGVVEFLYPMIVCFDVRSEKFSFITIGKDSIRVVTSGNLINYNGKLGFVYNRRGFVDGTDRKSGSIDLWVLEDYEKNKWTNRSYVLPAKWQFKLGIKYLNFVGMTRTNEILFSPMEPMRFCVFYYNMERNTIVKVQIKGMEVVDGDVYVYKFLDHIEDVKFMQVL